MSLDFNVMVGGEAGQGVQSVSAVLSKVMMRGGYHVYTDQDYESRIRGGHSFSRVRISDKEVMASSEAVNILIALNQETIDIHRNELQTDGSSVIIYDREKIKGEMADGHPLFNVPLERLAVETTANKLMFNTVAVGAAMGLAEYNFDLLADVLRQEFGRRSAEVAENNIKAARAGYDFARQAPHEKFTARIKPIGEAKKMLITGNEALALGAMAAGCKLVAGYPMTPTTPILEYIADKGRQFGIKVIEAEDEISAANMAVGAGYAGVRAMTATSGGGFCLMVEAVSLAGMTETPVVFVLGQRPGPAIGLPTRTEQGELFFALHAGHGEFPRAVLAPASVEDCFWLTVKAFNLAEKFQTPVIIVTDHDLADATITIDKFDLSKVTIERGALLSDDEANQNSSYKRYQFNESGISPRAVPMQGKALVVADSDEHNEEGHIIEDAETRRKMMQKRMHKQEEMRAEMAQPRFLTQPEAKITLVGWGSTYGALKEAQDLLQQEGTPVNLLHFNELWPFPADDVSFNLNQTHSVVVENNYSGQLAQLIRRETGIKVNRTVLRYDGRAFTARYIVNELKREVIKQ